MKIKSTPKRFSLLFSAVLTILLLHLSASAAPLATHSFTNSTTAGTHPSTLVYSGDTITVDLSAIRNAVVYRAIFTPNRRYTNIGSYPGSTNAMNSMIIKSSDEDVLQLLPPRYLFFDATAAVRDALAGGGTQLTLTVASRAGLAASGETLSLEVMCDTPLPTSIEQVTQAAAVHRDGDTMITFKEVDSPIQSADITCETYNDIKSQLDVDNTIRYRIYRSSTPITHAADLETAELIDELPPLSCWNGRYHGRGNCTGDKEVPRFPVDDLVPAEPETGIYVHRIREGKSGDGYYFISRAVDGAEDFSSVSTGANATEAVTEATGPGMVLERSTETPTSFRYVNFPTLHYYVRWESPPYHNLPSEPYNYLVAEPPAQDAVSPAPVDVALHCWGGSLNGGYGWWYRAEEGSLLLSTNQYPYDWWTAYHENYNTLKPFSEGTVQPFNQARILSFLYDFVTVRFNIDQQRILLSGSSMGGSGASMWGMRSGHIFSHIISWVGIHTPAESPHFLGSFEGVYGSQEWNTTYSNNSLERFGYEVISPQDNISAFDYWDTSRWLREHPATETPWISFANGKNDSGIGWPQAHEYVQALRETKRPFNFHWGQGGHGQRAQLIDGSDRRCGLDFAKNQVQPVVLNSSLDNDVGESPETGDDEGQINRFIKWDPENTVETHSYLELSLWLIDSAPVDQTTMDIGFRRLSTLQSYPETRFHYENHNGSDSVVNSGYVQADEFGLFILPGIQIAKGEKANRIILTRQMTAGFDQDDDQDIDGLDLSQLAKDIVAGQSSVEDARRFSSEFGMRQTATSP